jgi:AcrR family transcriptional regulator
VIRHGTETWDLAAEKKMATSAYARPDDEHRPRLRRGALTRELIVAEALRLLDTGGVAGFSLPKLGRALGADPTAVYRHFASKDDLVLAVADALIAESVEGLVPTDCWVETLERSSRQIRKVYRAHPAAASIASYRTTQGESEMTAVNIIIDCVLRAGFEGRRAAEVYRAVGDFALYWSGGEASFMALDRDLQARDQSAWTTAYLAADRGRYPAIHQIRDQLADVEADPDVIFETALSILSSGLQVQAPRPCECPRHAAVG